MYWFDAALPVSTALIWSVASQVSAGSLANP
jgi:hypothetical protein